MKKALTKFRDLLYKIPLDKQLHAYYGSITYKIFFILILLIPSNLSLWEVGLIATIPNGFIVGLGKEELDKYTGNKFDFNDIFATCIGSLIEGILFTSTLYAILYIVGIYT